jgi:two-component system OmpR family response regulator
MLSTSQTGCGLVSPDLISLGGDGADLPRRPRPELVTKSLGTVLIVDDEQETTNTFARVLRLEGFEVRTAVSAEVGLHEAEAARPDAIILDLRMPLLDGLGFLQRLRARDEQRETPVAVVTGDYFLDDTVAADLRRLGAHIKFKPLWVEDLVELAHELITAETEAEGR